VALGIWGAMAGLPIGLGPVIGGWVTVRVLAVDGLLSNRVGSRPIVAVAMALQAIVVGWLAFVRVGAAILAAGAILVRSYLGSAGRSTQSTKGSYGRQRGFSYQGRYVRRTVHDRA
jgi:hypothetical protein